MMCVNGPRLVVVVMSMILVHAVGCKPHQKPNQEQSARSPSGAYTVIVPVEHVSGREFKAYWHPTILDAAGAQLFKDAEGFPALFNIYWRWDRQDRLWVKNSDDGRVYYYELTDNGWSRTSYEPGSATTTNPAPPPALYSR